jgi:hypothetical protein
MSWLSDGKVAWLYGAVVALIGSAVWMITAATNSHLDGVWVLSWLLVPLGPALVPLGSIITVFIALAVGNSVGIWIASIIMGLLYGLAAVAQMSAILRVRAWWRASRHPESNLPRE